MGEAHFSGSNDWSARNDDGKDKKDHIYAYILSCKILFQLTVTVFEENVN